MPDHVEPLASGDFVLARVTADAPRWLLCADVLLSEVRCLASAGRELADLLAAYPGCRVAIGRQAAGRWCAAVVRGRGALLLLPPAGTTVGPATAAALGRALYHHTLWTDEGGSR